MLQTTLRDNRVVDVMVVQNLSTSLSFFASILIIGGLLVPAGKRIAGTQQASGRAEVAWAPVPRAELALEGRAQSDVPVNDANSARWSQGF